VRTLSEAEGVGCFVGCVVCVYKLFLACLGEQDCSFIHKKQAGGGREFRSSQACLWLGSWATNACSACLAGGSD
jgi:hypothetical protein